MIVCGGQLVTPEGVVRADLAVEDGRISAIAPELCGDAHEIDARGLTVFPGLIDVHVHFNEPGRTEWEGAASGSQALAAGGGTMYFDMPLNSSPCTVGGAEFDAKRAALERASLTDFALWGGIVPGNRGALAGLAERGVIGFKAFMADSGLPEFPRCDDLTLYEGMREAARLGLPVAVHAENTGLVRPMGTGTGVRDYLDSRPVLAEVEAIQRATLLASEAGAKLHIVHISSGRGVAAALEARARGVDVSIETCPHYLWFTEEDMERMGAVAKCAPPLRPAAERDRLRAALLQGEIDIVASDHSPAPLQMKRDENFFRVWGGIAGVQSTLAVLSRTGLLACPIARVTAENPARRFGLANKGRLAVGCDADFALLDLEAEFTVTRASLFQRHGLSPYVGSTFRGAVRRTVLRGETIFENGKITRHGGGRMIEHAKTRVHP
ncbi:Allantoinase [Candidatus Sulfopaludibacter sp. SbA6]|nr:Allantoinase [Candidatus Sulfopaludibacter sp. SbA6]